MTKTLKKVFKSDSHFRQINRNENMTTENILLNVQNGNNHRYAVDVELKLRALLLHQMTVNHLSLILKINVL